jgi:sugar/nucleoside kinase (ribokinase family)
VKNIACLGLVCADFIVKPVDTVPDRGKLQLVDSVELQIGGCASNTGIVAAKLGIEVGIFASVGNDALGTFIIDCIRKGGIGTQGIKMVPDCTSSGSVVLIHPDGERSFFHSIGANMAFNPLELSLESLSPYEIVHIAGVLALPESEGKNLLEFCRKLKQEKKIVTLDTVWDSRGIWLPAIEESLPYVDYFLPSIEEAKMLSGKEDPQEVAEFFLSRGVKNICLKMGEKGSMIFDGTESHTFSPVPVTQVDSTGAGDSYVAGFLVGLAKGYTFQECGVLANLVGAKAVTTVGATSGVKDWKDLLHFAGLYNVALL